MREVSRSYLDNYTKAINEVSARGQEYLRGQLKSIDYDRPIAEVRQDLIGLMDAVCGGSSQMAAMESAIFYDGLRERVLGSQMDAFAQDMRQPIATEKALKAFVQKLVDGEYDEFEALCLERLDWEVKAAAGRCTQYNVQRDHYGGETRYARVPTGEETCDFCIMLASRGPVYHTEESAGAYDHYHAHCVTGDTEVSGRGLLAGLRRDYKGPLISIVTGNGRKLSVTPNHPVLTTRGWVLAGDLKEGDSLICTRLANWHEAGAPDVKDVPPTAKEIFESASLFDSARFDGVPRAAEYLDGEVVTDCDIKVVNPDGFLKRATDSSVSKPLDHGGFAATDSDTARVGLSFNVDGASDSLFDGHDSSPDSIVCSSNLSRPSLLAHLGCPNDASAAPIPDSDTSISKESGYNRSAHTHPVCNAKDALTALVRFDKPFWHKNLLAASLDAIALENAKDSVVSDAELACNLTRTFPGEIETDNVSLLSVSEASCHVYNLSTIGGWYVSSGIITHNCDCRIVPFWGTYDAGPSRRGSIMGIEGYDPDALYERYVDQMLNPNFRNRMARAADRARGGSGNVTGRETSHPQLWAKAYREGTVTLGSVGEVQHYIRDAESYEDLFERIKLINKELPHYGLSSKYIQELQQELSRKRKQLIN